jgi:hypothetical protein
VTARSLLVKRSFYSPLFYHSVHPAYRARQHRRQAPDATTYHNLTFSTPFNHVNTVFYNQPDKIVEYEFAESWNSPSTRRSFEVRTEAAQELQPAMCAQIEANPRSSRHPRPSLLSPEIRSPLLMCVCPNRFPLSAGDRPN